MIFTKWSDMYKEFEVLRHIAMAANKINRVVGAIKRAFRYMNRTIFTQLNKPIVGVC